MARTLVAFTLATTGLLHHLTVALPGNADLAIPDSWEEANREYAPFIQDIRDKRETWFATFPDEALLLPDDRDRVAVDIGFSGWEWAGVYGIPTPYDDALQRTNPILVRILAFDMDYLDDDFRAAIEAGNYAQELEFLVRYLNRDGSEASSGDSVGVSARFQGMAKLGWSMSIDSGRIWPAYIATLDFEYVAPPGSEDPIHASRLEVGIKFPSGRVVWPSDDMDVTIRWLHPSEDLPDEHEVNLNALVRNGISERVGYRPKRIRLVVDKRDGHEAGRCKAVRLSGESNAIPMTDSQAHGEGYQEVVIHVGESPVQIPLDCELDQPTPKVVTVTIDLRFYISFRD